MKTQLIKICGLQQKQYIEESLSLRNLYKKKSLRPKIQASEPAPLKQKIVNLNPEGGRKGLIKSSNKSNRSIVAIGVMISNIG